MSKFMAKQQQRKMTGMFGAAEFSALFAGATLLDNKLNSNEKVEDPENPLRVSVFSSEKESENFKVSFSIWNQCQHSVFIESFELMQESQANQIEKVVFHRNQNMQRTDINLTANKFHVKIESKTEIELSFFFPVTGFNSEDPYRRTEIKYKTLGLAKVPQKAFVEMVLLDSD